MQTHGIFATSYRFVRDPFVRANNTCWIHGVGLESGLVFVKCPFHDQVATNCGPLAPMFCWILKPIVAPNTLFARMHSADCGFAVAGKFGITKTKQLHGDKTHFSSTVNFNSIISLFACDGLNFQRHVPKFLFVKNKRMLSQQNQNCSKYILLVPDVGRWLSARWSRQGYVPMDSVHFSLHKYFGMRNNWLRLLCANKLPCVHSGVIYCLQRFVSWLPQHTMQVNKWFSTRCGVMNFEFSLFGKTKNVLAAGTGIQFILYKIWPH